SQKEMRPELARELPARGQHRMLRLVPCLPKALGAIGLDHVAHLRRHDEIGAGVARTATKLAQTLDVGRGITPCAHLQTGGLEGRAHAFACPSFGSSFPARSRA